MSQFQIVLRVLSSVLLIMILDLVDVGAAQEDHAAAAAANNDEVESKLNNHSNHNRLLRGQPRKNQDWANNDRELSLTHNPLVGTSIQPRIIGGNDVTTNRFPYYSLFSGDFLCGAVLIGPRIVLGTY